MPALHWIGPPPPRRLVAALERSGVTLVRGRSPGGAVGRAIHRGGAPPRPLPSSLPWLWVTPGRAAPEAAAAAILGGAYDVVGLGDRAGRDRGDDGGDLEAAAATLARRAAELAAAALQPAPADAPGFIAESAAARRALGEIARAARTSMPVLLTGETGTGKDLAARLLHAWSPRRDRRFVPINCAAIPNELMEAELFGYVRGAFSGAIHDYAGQITAAAGGTVFLDEVDDTPPTLQVKLLRVLEDRVVSRLGENDWHHVDFRIIAATNRDLRALVRRGAFGDDLYQRLAIVQIQMPPLRDRLADLPAMVGHFIERFHQEEPAAPPVRRATPAALAAMARYPWPGNVRELRNVVFHALVNKRAGEEILLSDLPVNVVKGQPAEEAADGPAGAGGASRSGAPIVDSAALARRLDAGGMDLRAAVEELERTALAMALARAGGSPTRAARLLGRVGRGASRDPGGTVRAMMRRLGVS